MKSFNVIREIGSYRGDIKDVNGMLFGDDNDCIVVSGEYGVDFELSCLKILIKKKR